MKKEDLSFALVVDEIRPPDLLTVLPSKGGIGELVNQCLDEILRPLWQNESIKGLIILLRRRTVAHVNSLYAIMSNMS
jgi:hypothetical protein